MTLDADEKKQVAVLEKGQESVEEPQKDSKTTTKTKVYTEEEVEKKFSSQRSALDKKISILEKQTQDAIARAEKIEAERESTIKEMKEDKERLESELEELTRDAPDFQKMLKLYHGRINVLNDTIKTEEEKRAIAEAERTSWAEDIKAAKEVKRNVLMGEIAGEFEGGDTEILRDLCDKLEISDTPDKIRIIASSLWKKTEVSETPETKVRKEPPHADSGDNKGGRESLDGLSGKELLQKAHSKK